MIRLRNVAEETGERLKSLAALNRIVEFPSIATQNTPPRVLVAGDPGAAALPIINAISHICEQCACVLSVGQAMRALDHGKFDCAIFLPTDKNDPLFSLSRALGRHPKYCAMPIIHVVDSPEKTAIYAEVGAKDFILTSHISGDIAGKIQLSSRRARLARAMHAFLHACVGEGVRDPASGAFTPVFLAEHGARLCARADQTGRPLSAAIIRLSADNLRSKKIEPGRRALHQAVRLINRITRAEDVVARIAPETFLILMPAANEDAAARAALRVEGVLENTVFKSAHGNAPFALNALSAHCARPRGYCIEETVAHALRSLRAAEAETTRRPHRQFPR
jgi:PleD family two-component response regulator